jgi:hypothetical protein
MMQVKGQAIYGSKMGTKEEIGGLKAQIRRLIWSFKN